MQSFISRNVHGFSMPELIVTLALVAILLMGSFPIIRAPRTALLKEESTRIKNTIQFGILNALKTQRELSINFTESSYTLNELGSGNLIFKNKLPETVSILTAKSIRFFPSGVTSPGTISISNGSSECSITVSLRGRVQVKC